MPNEQSTNSLVGEALGLISRMLAELVETVPAVDADDYAADLERVDQIANLIS